jgi:hypothetical protein
MSKKSDKILNYIYDNRRLIIRYFIAAIICSVLRTVIDMLLGQSFEVITVMIWAIVFYPFLKFFVYKDRAESIFILLQQIIIYIFVITAVWLLGTFIKSTLLGFSSNAVVALSTGGAIQEIVCFFAIHMIVFKHKI